MRYEFTLERDVFIEVTVEADNFEEAEREIDRMENSGDLTDMFRDEVLETFTKIYGVKLLLDKTRSTK